MKPVKVGIIGAGRIGTIHARNLLQMPGVRLKAISDIQLERIADQARAWGVPVVTRDSGELLEDPDIDAVLICSSTDTHMELITQAAARGKHIFCEKPVSPDVKFTRQAAELVSNAGILFQTGFNRRFDPNFMRVKQSVEAGEIGTTQLVKITSRDPGPPPPDYIAKSGGMLLDMAIHDFDMARYLSGSDIVEVYVRGAAFDPAIGALGDIDTAVISLRFANGMLGVIDNSRHAAYGYDQRVEVFGSKGSVAAHNEPITTVEWSTAEGIVHEKPKPFFLERYALSYRIEMAAFIDAVREGSKTQADANDGYQAELAAYAAYRSLKEGRPVRVGEEDIS